MVGFFLAKLHVPHEQSMQITATQIITQDQTETMHFTGKKDSATQSTHAVLDNQTTKTNFFLHVLHSKMHSGRHKHSLLEIQTSCHDALLPAAQPTNKQLYCQLHDCLVESDVTGRKR